MSEKVNVVHGHQLPVTAGTYYRLWCMAGEQKDKAYYLQAPRLVLGRSTEADIPVHDAKASREHAELVRQGDHYILTDLKSQNGIVVNDHKIDQVTLKSGDYIIIGQTVFKYDVLQVGAGERTKTHAAAAMGFGDQPLPREDNLEMVSKKTSRRLTFLAIIGVVLYVTLTLDQKSEDKARADRKIAQESSTEFTQGLKVESADRDPEVEKKLEEYFQRGQREYRAGNYFRAIEEFNLALVLNPTNSRAITYLEKSKKSLDDDIQMNFQKARQEQESLRYTGASVSYCTILKLLQDYPEDERYRQAEDGIREIEKKMGLESGEIECLQRKSQTE
ncbi:MAG: FHA domain-containing protein [Bacteriovoracaceae bacterium]|nr:FHA domain-containing protein [Bacteriovoracaceae bacterium]